MHAQRRYERGQARQKVERLQNDVRRAVAIGSLELQPHIALGGEREPLNRDGGAAHVAGEPFKLPGLLRFDAGAGVERKARVLRDTSPRLLL